MKKILVFLLCLVILFSVSGCTDKGNVNGGAANGGTSGGADEPISGDTVYSDSEITITAGDTVLRATMYDNETARNFLELLPFTLPTIERSGLAKGVHLPRYIQYESEKLTRNYKLGEIGYWPDAARYTKNVLILHGDSDGIVPVAYSERAEREYPSA